MLNHYRKQTLSNKENIQKKVRRSTNLCVNMLQLSEFLMNCVYPQLLNYRLNTLGI